MLVPLVRTVCSFAVQHVVSANRAGRRIPRRLQSTYIHVQLRCCQHYMIGAMLFLLLLCGSCLLHPRTVVQLQTWPTLPTQEHKQHYKLQYALQYAIMLLGLHPLQPSRWDARDVVTLCPNSQLWHSLAHTHVVFRIQAPIFGNDTLCSGVWLSETRLRYKQHRDAVLHEPFRPADSQMAATEGRAHEFMCVPYMLGSRGGRGWVYSCTYSSSQRLKVRCVGQQTRVTSSLLTQQTTLNGFQRL